MTDRPADPPPQAPPAGLSPVLARNIAALQARRERDRARDPLAGRLADRVTRTLGSPAALMLQAGVVAGWALVNLGLVPGVRPFDRTFVGLATTASVEGVFLSTFVLISQNRAAAAADRRADLDLQTNLLAEHEVSRLAALVQAIARKLDVAEADAPDLPEITQDVAPDTVLDGLDAARDR